MEETGYINRDKVIIKAIHDCLCELYKRAQPSVDFDELVKNTKKDEIVYDRYYLSDKNYRYIVNMYSEAYHIKSLWYKNCWTMRDYLINGGFESIIDDPWSEEPGPSFLEKEIGKENKNKVIDLLNSCANRYSNNRDENSFRFNVMNVSPTCNKEQVIEYWKKQGKEIKIKDYDIEEIYFPSEK